MKNIYITLIALLFAISLKAEFTGNSHTGLTGIITDKNGEPVQGVSVFLPELKTGTITNEKGKYWFENLPKRNMLIQISAIGYKMIAENIDLTSVLNKDFVLTESVTEINEIIVTGHSGVTQMIKMPNPMSVVTKSELQQTSASNIIDAISTQPGISQITTGNGISKPVIRGLGYNRVIVLNNGVRQEGQQWGDEHGIEIDENEVDRVEILKGPASLLYGSDAMAGVINFISAPALPEGKQMLNALAGYQTNNGLIAYSLNYSGHRKEFVWDFRYSHKQAHAYRNKQDGYVYNSGYAENAASGLLGVSNWWGYSHLTLSAYALSPGIVEGTRNELTGEFMKPVIMQDGSEGEAIASNADFLTYKHLMPYQNVGHYEAVLNNNFLIGEGSLKATFAYQQNRRKEYEDITAPDEYALYFQLHTINYNVNYQFPVKNGLEISFGANGMYQSSLNLGREFLVPEYRLFDAGMFLIGKKAWKKLNINGGIRYDKRFEKGYSLYLNSDGEKTSSSDPASVERFKSFSCNFGGWSGSVGAAYQLNENWNTKINLSAGFRAPNISELGSNGVHEGTIRYELGDTELKPEKSLQIDYELGYNTEHVSARINLFTNDIRNYIFSRKLSSFNGGDSIADDVPVFKFVSGNAILYGGEVYIDMHPHPFDWLHFENSFSFVNAQLKNQSDSTKYLPFTPAPRIKSDIRADLEIPAKYLRNSFISIGIEYNFTQKHIYSAFNTETSTPAYTLLNAGIGSEIYYRKRKVCTVLISGTNLTDIVYQSHLSRLKYTSINNITGKTGVFNMGQNVGIKLIVPVEL